MTALVTQPTTVLNLCHSLVVYLLGRQLSFYSLEFCVHMSFSHLLLCFYVLL